MLQLFSQCRIWVHLIRIRSRRFHWNGRLATYRRGRFAGAISNSWSMSEAKKASNFFKDMRCVPVNPARRVLPSMPASFPAEIALRPFWESPAASGYSGPALAADLKEIADLSHDALKTDDTDRATSRSGFFRQRVKTSTFRRARRRRR